MKILQKWNKSFLFAYEITYKSNQTESSLVCHYRLKDVQNIHYSRSISLPDKLEMYPMSKVRVPRPMFANIFITLTIKDRWDLKNVSKISSIKYTMHGNYYKDVNCKSTNHEPPPGFGRLVSLHGRQSALRLVAGWPSATQTSFKVAQSDAERGDW
jgi:hypothetical protein